MENVKTKKTFIIEGNDKEYLTTLYKDSVSDSSSVDNAMKFDNLEECEVVVKLASKYSNFTKSRILVVESKTYYLEKEEIPEINL